MKKIIQLSLVGALVGMAHLASAQVQLAVGLKGGLNFARLNNHYTVAQNYGTRTGYHLGAYAMLKISKFAIQPEIVFSRQGQNFSYNNQSLNSNYDYVNIPIMIKFYLGAGFNLQAGPQFGFLAGAKGDVINAQGPAVSAGQDLKDFVKSSDLSLGFGFGWDLPLGINIGARYNLGLSDINKHTGKPAGQTESSMGNVEAKNQVIQISVGYRLFKIGK